MVLIALICNIFALQRPHGRDYAGRDSNVTQSSPDLESSNNSMASDILCAEVRNNLNIGSDSASFYRGSI